MKITELLFLPIEHNVSRSYMAAMRDLGLEPEKIIFLECEETGPRPQTAREPFKKQAFDLAYEIRERFNARRFLGAMRFLKDQFTAWRGERSRALLRQVYEHLVERMTQHAKHLGLPVENPKASVQALLLRYGWSYETRHVHSLNDDDFVEWLRREWAGGFALYTGGGILRKPVLSAGVKFIHIHPGIVPDLRGSHCLLWSVLVRGFPGFSCFFMNEGIDTGDIIATREYPLVPVPLPRRFWPVRFADLRADALINGLDPWYRGDLLRCVLRDEPRPSRWRSQKQIPGSGKQYYFPHRLIRDKAVGRLLRVL